MKASPTNKATNDRVRNNAVKFIAKNLLIVEKVYYKLMKNGREDRWNCKKPEWK